MKKKGLLHSLIMTLCCLIPMLALLAIFPQVKNKVSGFNWSWLMFLLCPLMHILLMKGLMGDGSCHGKEKVNKQGEENASLANE